MNIGGRSTNTILDIFTTGIRNVLRELGIPTIATYKTKNCAITAKSEDLSKVISVMTITFNTREGVTLQELEKAITETKIGCRVKLEETKAEITVPPLRMETSRTTNAPRYIRRALCG
jgi:hypothetical protein